ncbi:hypothetical protein EDB85DRAFT_1889378 [Lactarius pseudohatsudake]|nr:hypothetical protein EDB85DRAFT_1889378 [Lactarius pseudohatsudake]
MPQPAPLSHVVPEPPPEANPSQRDDTAAACHGCHKPQQVRRRQGYETTTMKQLRQPQRQLGNDNHDSDEATLTTTAVAGSCAAMTVTATTRLGLVHTSMSISRRRMNTATEGGQLGDDDQGPREAAATATTATTPTKRTTTGMGTMAAGMAAAGHSGIAKLCSLCILLIYSGMCTFSDWVLALNSFFS